ncbi:restriction endonuclease subunit S [Azotobacter chroococcum subsp. isscasi]|uniref:restriction endonuclease subunit S n=1 Tax=Azotobacter chroococcum TaxID=353 RepID=UPI00103A72EC|nr:restriction endonuclease subunit S [Azotobacter chroococcum]TBW11687.1 restriction endonuclease subunit S [Azotobacter chroococcum subsp. isscasi]
MSHYKPYPAYKDSGVAWLGRVPEHWQLMPLKRLVRSIEQGWSPECEARPAESGEWGVVKVGCVNGGRFRPEENKALPVSLEPRPELGLCKGDVLVSRANTRELVGSCAVVPQDYPNLLLCDKIYRIRAGEWVTPKFLAALITVHGRRAVEIEATGASSSMLNISQSVILNLPVALPEPAEQDQIMAAASHETARIDALVAKKTRFIELLREKRQALITHAVTKGLDPSVKMKDSGVKWLGEVPEHWELAPLKRLISSIAQGWSPECEARTPDSGEWGVVKVGCVNGGVFRPEESKALPAEMEARPELGLRKGDVLVSRANTRELVGSCAVVPKDYPHLLLCDKLYRIGCGARVTPDFLAALITVYGRRAVEIEATGASSSMVNIAQSVILDLFVAIPSKQEQDVIMDRISVTTARIESLCAKTERSIELLKERRSALITAAVTGQIDLREAV